MERNWEAMLLAEVRAQEKQRADDWPLAMDWLHVTFEVNHGGGIPTCLAEGTPKSRLVYLQELGFLVQEQFELHGTMWVHLTCRISVNLSDGWVYRPQKW